MVEESEVIGTKTKIILNEKQKLEIKTAVIYI